MPSQPAPWTVHREYVHPRRSRFYDGFIQHRALSPLKYGDALWSVFFCLASPQAQSNIDCREPGPIYSYRRVKPGDVGYVRRGRFHLLFSAEIPLRSRRLGIDVPLTFEPLDVGPTTLYEAPPPNTRRLTGRFPPPLSSSRVLGHLHPDGGVGTRMTTQAKRFVLNT